jgi:hypothetical protein
MELTAMAVFGRMLDWPMIRKMRHDPYWDPETRSEHRAIVVELCDRFVQNYPCKFQV